MFNTIWSTLKRATVGEKLRDVGKARGGWGTAAGVDIRRMSDGRTFVTLTVSSNFSVEANGRKTVYAYFDDAEVEKLSAVLTQAVEARGRI